MDESTFSRPADRIVALLDRGEQADAVAHLEQFADASADERKGAVQSLRPVATQRAAVLAPLSETLAGFLEDEERSIRLSTAKLLVTIAESSPESVVSLVPTLADRLADDDEFYFVCARSAEALGYVALEKPDAAATRDVLADLWIGLSFDEPEVKEKLAKALEYVAVGDPDRLRHHLPRLADHLDDENELVRYHLCTAIVAVGAEYPSKLGAVREALTARLDDESAHVRGRVSEALGVLARSGPDQALPREPLESLASAETDFVAERAQFALGDAVESAEEFGSTESVRATTEAAVDAITAPDGDGNCPNCGCPLPENGPPFCPDCGAPY